MSVRIESETAPEDVDSADPLADHRILVGSVELRIASIRDCGVHGVAVLEPIQAPAGVDCGIQIRRR